MNSGLVAASQPGSLADVATGVTDASGAVGATDGEADSAGEVAGAVADAPGETAFAPGLGSTPTGPTHPATTTMTSISTAAALIG